MRNLATLVMMFLICVSLMAQVATAPVTGDGTVQNPYEIASLENLYWIAASDDIVPNPDQEARWSSHYVQIANIDASDTENWFDGQGWTPIGTGWFYSFSGIYNGQNYTIDAIFIESEMEAAGGLFGVTIGATIENLGVTNVDITAGAQSGGLAGYLWESTVCNAFSTGIVRGEESIGGLVGVMMHSNVVNSYSEVNVIGASNFGGLVGRFENSSVVNSFYNFEEIFINNQNIVTVGALDNTTYNSWLNNDLYLDIDEFLFYDGDRYLINTVDDFIKLLAFAQYEEYSYRLTASIDLQGYTNFFIPIFSGDFDGNGFIINNLTVDIPCFYIGLFGIVHGATIENLVLTNVYVSGLYCIGGLVGYQADTEIINSYVTGFVNGFRYVGGLVGIQFECTILGSSFSGIVDGHSYIGSIVGRQSNSSISNCFSNGNTSGSRTIGGLVGMQFESTMSDCFSTGTVSGSFGAVGGLAGYQNRSFISTSYNTGNVTGGNVTGYEYVGGLVGSQSESTISDSYSTGSVVGDDRTGGLVGSQRESTISNSYSTGDVEGSLAVGGLVGYQKISYIYNSYSNANVTGQDYVGGSIGILTFNSYLTNSYSTGNVSGNNYVGGLIGLKEDSPIITNSYWNTETSGQTESDGGEGRTTDEMTYPYAANTYVDWDFAEIWAADVDFTINQGYPFLQEMPVSVDKEVIAVIESPILSNYPNPFNPETTMNFSLPQDTAMLDLKIYNIRGQLVRTLIAGTPFTKGEHQIVWDGRNDSGKTSASGIFFYRLTTPNFTQQKKMMLLK